MSTNANGSNGAPPQAEELVDTVILTYNRRTDHLDIGGTAASLDLILDMLGRARRAIEFQQRKAQALEIQAAAVRAAEDARIAAAIRNGR